MALPPDKKSSSCCSNTPPVDCCGPKSEEPKASAPEGGCCSGRPDPAEPSTCGLSSLPATSKEADNSICASSGAGCCRGASPVREDIATEKCGTETAPRAGDAACSDEIPTDEIVPEQGSCGGEETGCCAGAKTSCCEGADDELVMEQASCGGGGDDCCAGEKSADSKSEVDGPVTKELSCGGEKSDCCAGKKTPCCNESCIDRLTERECRKDLNCKRQRSKTASFSSGASSECCPNGISTRQFYRNLLKSLGCLCRTVKSRGEPTCCSPSRRSSIERPKSSGTGRHDKQKVPAKSSSRPIRVSAVERTSGGAQSHRIKKPSSVTIHTAESGALAPDLERGDPQFGHVVLSVSGMTCTGCETKLQRTLASIKSIQNVKTSIVLCRTEFDLDLRSESVASAIHQLERMTGFKLEEINQEGTEIEVCPADAKSFVHQPLPKGVLALEAVNDTVVKISFDPSVIGARDLIERGFTAPLELAPIKADPGLAAGSRHVRHTGFMTLLSAMLTIPVIVLAWAPIPERPIVHGSASLVLATLVQFVVAGPFYPAALKALIFSRLIEMDLLIVISTSAAYIYSVVAFGYMVAGNPLSTGEFFETSTLLVTLIMVGRFVSALARHKAVESVSMRSLQTPTAVIVDEQTSAQSEIDARLLQYGDLFRVAPESRVPTDGKVSSGVSEVDESMVTGEALPVAKKPGSIVIAGSINGSGVLTVRLGRLPSDNTISAIASMVDEAKLTKPKFQDVADKVASYFVPIAIAMGVIVFLIWIPIGLRVRDYGGSEAVINALTYGITVIIVSCPCAIGLAVPMVIMIASGVAAKHGCIFKAATTIEVAKKTSHVVFDKTGTLTQGKLTVTKSKYFMSAEAHSKATITDMTAAVLSDIKHPVAIAVWKHLEAQTPTSAVAHNVTALPSKGVEGHVNGQLVKAGNSRWLELADHPDVQDYLSRGYTTFCISVNDHFTALFGLEDALRPDAASTIYELQSRGISISIVSGDDEGPVSALARQLNLTSYRSRCTPADKKAFMQSINPHGKITTIFCGDGTNDAVALAQATIGIHMNEGTDVAKSAADVILARSSLTDILTLIDLSKAAMRRIVFNFGWAFTYNAFAILLASGALVTARIPPEYAGLGELVSVLPVIAIAMQLRWAKFQKTAVANE